MIERQAASDTQSKDPAPAKAGVGRFQRRGVVLTLLCSAVLGLSAAAGSGASYAYRDGPPPGFSGGFGEDHCQACHFPEKDGKLNAPPGTLAIAAPARYVAGKSYPVTVTLTRPDMKIGGFQLTARFEDGAQAGAFVVDDAEKTRVKVLVDRGVHYAYHMNAGTALTAPHAVRWTILWTAPEDSRTVQFHAAANAANADESQFGDFIYTQSIRSVRAP